MDDYLKEQCAYYAAKLASELMRSGHVAEDRRVPNKVLMFPFALKYIESKQEREIAFMTESCYVALTHPDPVTAFRACVTAFRYAQWANVLLSDALSCAKERVESFLPKTDPQT